MTSVRGMQPVKVFIAALAVAISLLASILLFVGDAHADSSEDSPLTAGTVQPQSSLAPQASGSKAEFLSVVNSQPNGIGGSRYGSTVNWCARFVVWCARQAGVSTSAIPNEYVCSTLASYYKNRGQWLSCNQTPQAGDLVFYSSSCNGLAQHVGVVTDHSGSTIYTKEGNTDYGIVNSFSNRKVTSNGYQGNWDTCSYIVGFARPSYSSESHSPEGYLDIATGGDGTIRVRGWALDRDNPNATLSVHVYVGGPAGQGEGFGWIVANQARPDVNKALGVSGNHGFDAVIKTSKRGSVSVYAYGINVGGGSNALLANVKTATVLEPKGNAATVPEGTYAIRSKLDTSMGLDVAGASKDENVNVWLYKWNSAQSSGSTCQKFRIKAAGDGSYYIIATHSNRAVEVYGGLTSSGANVSQHSQNQTVAQRWFFDKNSDGTYTVRQRNSGLVMDVTGAKTTNGTNIQQHAKNGSNAQKFYLVPTDASKWSVSVPSASRTYTGRAWTPAPTVTAGGVAMRQGTDYTVSYADNVNAGTAAVRVKAAGGFAGSATKRFSIAKRGNSLKVKAVKAKQTVKRGKAATLAASKVFRVTQNASKGTVTYKKKSGNKRISVSSTGKVTIKKGLAKGTYKVVAKATSKATSNYSAKTVSVAFNINVK